LILNNKIHQKVHLCL